VYALLLYDGTVLLQEVVEVLQEVWEQEDYY
jgi:hypothetical protein